MPDGSYAKAFSFLAHSLFVGNQQDRDAPLLVFLIQ
jgi:hypothetical protein